MNQNLEFIIQIQGGVISLESSFKSFSKVFYNLFNFFKTSVFKYVDE